MYIEATHGLEASNALFGGMDQLIIHSLKVANHPPTQLKTLVHSVLRETTLYYTTLYCVTISSQHKSHGNVPRCTT